MTHRSSIRNLRRSTMASRAGLTIVELLVAAFIFVVLLSATTGLLVSSGRAYRVNEARSTAIQDAEAVLQLIRYEFGLAGYRGLTSAFDQAFSDGGPTVEILRDADGDRVTIRYFEDVYVASGAEERVVTFYVDQGTQRLVREEDGVEPQEMVGGVARFEVLQYIRRDRGRVPVEDDDLCGGYCEVPDTIAGLNLTVFFVDGTFWRFPVGFYNPQTVVGPGGA